MILASTTVLLYLIEEMIELSELSTDFDQLCLIGDLLGVDWDRNSLIYAL